MIRAHHAGHIFHEPCIRKWTNSKQPTPSGERTKKPDWCPLCRAKIQRPISNKGNTRENSRFRKLVFQGDIRTDLSSSPVRLHQGIGNDVAGIGSKRGKKALIVRGSSSEDEEIMLEEDNEESTRRRAMLSAAQRREGAEEAGTVLTESESDEENARPARPVYPRLNSASAAAGPSTTGQINNETTDNSGVNTLGEARATITLKNTQINTLREQLATSADQLTLANEARKEAIEEKEVVENRLVEKCEELRKIMEEARKAKEEKKALSRTLRSEVERVGELNRTNRRLIEELTVLKEWVDSLQSLAFIEGIAVRKTS